MNIIARFLRKILIVLAILQIYSPASGADPTHLIADGGRNDLSPDGKWVYFDRVVLQKPYEMEIFKARIDGTDEQCLTCKLELPQVIGQPLVHPSGRGLLFQGLTHTAALRKKALYYHPSWGFHNDFYWLDLSTMQTKLLLDCSQEFGKAFGAACLHPQFSPDGHKLLFASRSGAGFKLNPWQWWAPVIADFDLTTLTVANLKEIMPRHQESFYETHQLFDDGSFIYSFSRGTYPQGAYLYRDGQTQPIYTPGNGDWVEHAWRLPGGRILLNTSKGRWMPAQGVKSLKLELSVLTKDGIAAITNFGQVTSDFSCYAATFCVVQVADLSDTAKQPRLYRIALDADHPDANSRIAPPKLLGKGNRVDWNQARGQFAVDEVGSDGYYDICLRDAAWRRQGCLQTPADLQKHHGHAVWHPSGKWLVFQAQKQNTPASHNLVGMPGRSVNNDLWATDLRGHFRRLESVPLGLDRNAQGLLFPQFSPDGSRLIWARRDAGGTASPFGVWSIGIADVMIRADRLQLNNIRYFQPNGEGFYETHPFEDQCSFLYTYHRAGLGMDIYRHNLCAETSQRLTPGNPRIWEEHATPLPDGRILWISSGNYGIDQRQSDQWALKSELWLMNRDGSNARQLTYFNVPGHPHYALVPAKWRQNKALAAAANTLANGKIYLSVIPNPVQWGKDTRFVIRTQLTK